MSPNAVVSNMELIRDIAEKCCLPQNKVRKILSRMVEYVTDELMYGEGVEIRGLGIFLLTERAPRKARNLRTGEPMIVPACRVIRFRMSRALSRKMKMSDEPTTD